MIGKTVCLTGHRHIPPEKRDLIARLLEHAICEAYEDGYRRFMCGGALGFDTLAAIQILRCREKHPDLKLVLVIPCENQDARWTKEDRSVYQSIRAKADEQVVLSPAYYQGCMQTRNRYMVDHSSLCICYLWSFHGGTAYTVRYAAFRNIHIINLAMNLSEPDAVLREHQCSSMFIYHSVKRNAVTVHLSPSRTRNLKRKNTLASC